MDFSDPFNPANSPQINTMLDGAPNALLETLPGPQYQQSSFRSEARDPSADLNISKDFFKKLFS
jgi:hypothetical protein